MPDIDESEISYPCYLLHDDDGELASIETLQNDHICICLFTDAELLRDFWLDRNGEDSAAWDMEVTEYLSRDKLLDDLKSAQAELAEEGVHYIAFDPEPGRRVNYITIRHFIKRLQSR